MTRGWLPLYEMSGFDFFKQVAGPFILEGRCLVAFSVGVSQYD